MRCVAVALLFTMSQCPAQASKPKPVTVSWFTGSRGACGRLSGFYAAHRTAPCGTRYRLTYHGRSVTVTIRDRGPYHRDSHGRYDRTLDLSRSAFAKLDKPSRGLVKVTYRKL